MKRPRRPWVMVLALIPSGWLSGSFAWAQVPPPPAPNPTAEIPGPAPVDEPEIDLHERVRQLEGLVRELATERSALEGRIRELESRPSAYPSVPAPGMGGSVYVAPYTPGSMAGPAPGPSAVEENLTRGGAAGVSPVDPGDQADMPAPVPNVPLRLKFGPGFQLSDEDDEYVLQFHNLTQVDGRFELQNANTSVTDTFGLPRQWFIFNGRLTKPFEYYVAINEGFDNLNLLDAYLNVHFVDWLQFKVGRYKTPYTYEFYALPVQGLINPERSQFFNNFALNRNVGLMLWGQMFEKRFDYAAGIFNGNRNGFLDFDNGKDVAAFANFLPFLKSENPVFRHLNIGGSLDAGSEFTPTIPNRLRLNVPTQANQVIGIPFLQFVDGTLESGARAYWSLHAAWYYKQLSLISEWQSGFEFLAPSDNPVGGRARVPTQSFYVQSGYFLTGETVESRGVVKPNREFDLRHGRFGPGAVELALRYNYLYVGDEIFRAGFADPDLWTNEVQTVDVGVNWYWNQYIKVYLGWQHAAFGDPVLFSTSPNVYRTYSDLLWFRFQVYF